MFRSVILFPTGLDQLDIGFLAEALLFYGKVQVIGARPTLSRLLSHVSLPTALELLHRGNLEFHFLSDGIGVVAGRAPNGRTVFNSITFSMPDLSLIDHAEFCIDETGSSRGRNDRNVARLVSLLKPLAHRGFDHDLMEREFCDPSQVEPAIGNLLRVAAPEFSLPDAVRFRLHKEGKGLILETNLDFERLIRSNERLSASYVMSLFQAAREQLMFSADLQSEIATDRVTSKIHEVRLNALIRERDRSETKIAGFNKLVLGDAHAIRNAINSRSVPFADILPLLDSAHKFRDWIQDKPPNADLLHDYYRETVKKSWVENLPPKTIRWLIFTALGVFADAQLGTSGGGLGGAAVGALDLFFMDKLLKGWRPHNFVENELRPTFSPEQQK